MNEQKTHWKKVFNSDYLGSCDFEDTKDKKLIIKNVVVKKVKNTDGKEQERNVAYFTDPKIKPMILNVTNCKVIKKFAKTSFIDEWVNIAVSVYVKDDIKAFGDITEGLRIRETQPNLSKAELTPSMPAWNEVVKFLAVQGNTIEKVKSKYTISVENEAKLKDAVLTSLAQ